jgi:general secretion pathway protein D
MKPRTGDELTIGSGSALRKAYRLPVLAMGVLAMVATGLAQTSEVPAAASAGQPRFVTDYQLPGLDKKISLDLLEAMDVVDLIKFLAVKGNLNVVIGREVSGSSKLMIKDVTIGEALEIVLGANGLAYEIRGNIIKVMSDKEYRELHGEGFYERKQAKVVTLKYGLPSRMAQMLAEIKSSLGKIVSDDSTGTLVLIDTPEKIREMEAVIERGELPTVQRLSPTVTTNFVLQYAKVEDVEPQVQAVLSKDMGQLRADKRTKTLVITDLPHLVQKASEVIALFDRESKQVFIEAKIVQVELRDSFSLGVNWDHLFQGLDPRFALKSVSKTSGQMGLDPAASVAQGLGGSLTYHTIAAGADLNIVVQALATAGKTKLLQNPHIATMDGKEATIKAITTQPYSELQYETGSSNIVGKTYKFVDVGVSLGVTPRINELGFITCEIRPEISSVLNWYDADPTQAEGNSGVPVVKKSYAETSITVKDGVTIIIAGMIDESQVKERTQVPLLGSIPLLGTLFRQDRTVSKNSETIVLLTPRIVTGDRFFERSKDMKKPVKGVAGGVGLSATDMTP